MVSEIHWTHPSGQAIQSPAPVSTVKKSPQAFALKSAGAVGQAVGGTVVKSEQISQASLSNVTIPQSVVVESVQVPAPSLSNCERGHLQVACP
jgi:hypothetical protein